MPLAIVPATLEDKPLIANLLQLYLYDFSEFMGWTLNAHGSFDYRYLDHYWTEEGRYPFLFRVDGALAGFALVRTLEGDEPVHAMAEFFVMRGFRRGGIGATAAHALFDRFPGHWSVMEMEQNTAALRFWRRVIDRHAPGAWTERRDDRGRFIQEFETASSARNEKSPRM
jgi:predicted acetyltransferase